MYYNLILYLIQITLKVNITRMMMLANENPLFVIKYIRIVISMHILSFLFKLFNISILFFSY